MGYPRVSSLIRIVVLCPPVPHFLDSFTFRIVPR